MEAILESLPPAEGEAEQLAVIEQLSRENQAAGAALTAERGRVVRSRSRAARLTPAARRASARRRAALSLTPHLRICPPPSPPSY
jgi:hypothetical protein